MTMVKMVAIRMEVVFNVSRFTSCFHKCNNYYNYEESSVT